MIYFGKLLKASGRQITLELDEDLDLQTLFKYADGKPPYLALQVDDERTLSIDQRKKIYALLKDIADFTGYSPIEAKEYMKFNYYLETGAEEFSMANCSVVQASEFIKYLIEFCFTWNVPFKEKAITLAEDVSHYLWLCLKYRKCAICGKKGDIHHQDNRIGMGRNRNTFDHRYSTFICLCREHHVQIHNLGMQEMHDLYHIVPIRVNEQALIDLKLMTERSIENANDRTT